MRHRKDKKTLGRKTAQRKALMRSLADSLILHGSIRTTVVKAKRLRSFVEPLITRAKAGTLAERRNITKVLYTDEAVERVMRELAPRYKDRRGGYTKITKAGARRNDAAEMAVIEFV